MAIKALLNVLGKILKFDNVFKKKLKNVEKMKNTFKSVKNIAKIKNAKNVFTSMKRVQSAVTEIN